MVSKNAFLTNYSEVTFLQKIQENLRKCDSFSFSVSFIKKAGLVLLIKDLIAALERGVKGRLITSTYQNFTDIESLRVFLQLTEHFPQFECHLEYNSFYDEQYSTLGYHSKGYLFSFPDGSTELIVGSSNITRYALLKNVEWDLLVHTVPTDDVILAANKEFDELWAGTNRLNRDLIHQYEQQLMYSIERWDMDYDRSEMRVKPNYMQRAALKELNRYRAMGLGRAITVCSAGSGKTFLAAFDALNFNPKRLLYVVHESSILKKSLETFQIVFGPDKYCGLYTGESKELDADFLFATNVLMSRDLELFAPDTFDYIVIDECHHAVAESYKKIINYFKPEFLLGLTATPERMDNQDVLELFDRNVPYELRLRDAIINELIVPFHYFGIRDKMVDYGLAKAQERKMLAQIADADHCAFIHEEIEKHRPEGKLKALVFCRNITHARQMSEALGEYYHTAYLTGKNTVGERIRAYNDLQNENADLELLCSVDILNEGVDIPGVNMVLFLRPTESSTIFIQQLGRGLRKYAGKSFVTVLDFIGNSYKRSVQIALALGSLAQNLVLEKRLLMAMVQDDFRTLGLYEYGVQIDIDKLSKEEIVDYLEQENFNSLSYMKQDYENFKKYIGAQFYPRHMDYLNNDCASDLQKFMSIKIAAKKTGCYYEFLRGIEEEELPTFSEEQVNFLKSASSLLPLVRPHEYLILQELLTGPKTKQELAQRLQHEIPRYQDDQLIHALQYMKDTLIKEQEDGDFMIAVPVDEQFFEHLWDLIEYGLTKYRAEYGEETDFLLWHSYSMDGVQRKLLKNPGHTMLGTYVYGKTVVIFASLKKDASTEERLNYKDKYLTESLFQWECENNISAEKLAGLNNSDYAHVFVRKVTSEHGIVLPFTYVGKGKLTNPRKQEKPEGTTYLYDITMENALPDYLQYDYGVNQE